MSKLFFKSTDADLQKFQQSLAIIQKNVLYVTHQVDFIRKEILSMKIDKHLQEQAEEYLERDMSSMAEQEAEQV